MSGLLQPQRPPIESPETDQWDIDEERTAASQMEHYSSQQETHAFEISKAAVDALKDLDHGLRIQLGGKDCIDLRGETALKGGLAIADVTAG